MGDADVGKGVVYDGKWKSDRIRTVILFGTLSTWKCVGTAMSKEKNRRTLQNLSDGELWIWKHRPLKVFLCLYSKIFTMNV